MYFIQLLMALHFLPLGTTCLYFGLCVDHVDVFGAGMMGSG